MSRTGCCRPRCFFELDSSSSQNLTNFPTLFQCWVSASSTESLSNGWSFLHKTEVDKDNRNAEDKRKLEFWLQICEGETGPDQLGIIQDLLQAAVEIIPQEQTFFFQLSLFQNKEKTKMQKCSKQKRQNGEFQKKPTLRLWPYKLHPFRAIDPCELPNHWITKTHHFSQHLNFKPHLNLLRVSEIWCLIFTSRLKMRTTNISSSWLRNFCPTKLTESFTSCLVVILSMSSGKRVRKLRNLMLLSLCARSSCVNLHKTDRKARWNVLKSVSFRHMFTR